MTIIKLIADLHRMNTAAGSAYLPMPGLTI